MCLEIQCCNRVDYSKSCCLPCILIDKASPNRCCGFESVRLTFNSIQAVRDWRVQLLVLNSQTCRESSPSQLLSIYTLLWWSKKQTSTKFCGSKGLQPSHGPSVQQSGILRWSHCWHCRVTFLSDLKKSGCCRSPMCDWCVEGSCLGSRNKGWYCRKLDWKHCCSSLLGRWWS